MKRMCIYILFASLVIMPYAAAAEIPTSVESTIILKPYTIITEPAALNAHLEETPLSPPLRTALLYYYATINRPDMMQVLVTMGANPNGYFLIGDSKTPLLARVILESASADTSRILLEAGANPNAVVEMEGSLPVSMFLWAAKFAKHEQIIDALLNAGADPSGELLGLNAVDMIGLNRYLKNTPAVIKVRQATVKK